MTPMRYLTCWRMQLARQALAEQGVDVAEAAARSGYTSESAFTRVFKKEVGVTPAVYRSSAAKRSSRASWPEGRKENRP